MNMSMEELVSKKRVIDEGIRAMYEERQQLNEEIRRNRREEIPQTDDIPGDILLALEQTEKVFPRYGVVACQGVEGAYSQIAAEKLFAYPDIMYFTDFEGVFSAVKQGLCEYGVLPVENSSAGSVNRIYDLMMKYRVYIIRSLRLKVDHNLLVKPGTKLSDIKEIITHEQAVNQCSQYLKSLGKIEITVCANTAAAAKLVSESDRNDIAALSSRACADLYGLSCLAQSVQDKGNNYTRFICITRNLRIYPGADRTSIMAVLEHKPGALYNALGKFANLGINLVKLESRPIPDRDFEFMFYFDLETSVYSKELGIVLKDLRDTCDGFEYLGSYSELM